MNKQTAIDILKNLNVTSDNPIPVKDVFWWNDVFEALKTVIDIVESIEALEERAYDAENERDYANDELLDAKVEIKDLEEEIENLNKTIEDKDDEISRLEDIIAELERGDAA